MKLKLYTDDDILAGEIELPSGAMLLSNHNTVTQQLMVLQAAAKRHERGDPPRPGSNGGQSAPADKTWPGNRYHLIGKPILEGINRYVLTHQPVGHFLTAVLTNDLRTAFGRADPENEKILHDIVGYCYNEVPGLCQGTAAKYKAWTEMAEDKWPEITAPENSKEIDRQNAAGIWNVTQFKEVKP
jgi:hypothetical protein